MQQQTHQRLKIGLPVLFLVGFLVFVAYHFYLESQYRYISFNHTVHKVEKNHHPMFSLMSQDWVQEMFYTLSSERNVTHFVNSRNNLFNDPLFMIFNTSEMRDYFHNDNAHPVFLDQLINHQQYAHLRVNTGDKQNDLLNFYSMYLDNSTGSIDSGYQGILLNKMIYLTGTGPEESLRVNACLIGLNQDKYDILLSSADHVLLTLASLKVLGHEISHCAESFIHNHYAINNAYIMDAFYNQLNPIHYLNPTHYKDRNFIINYFNEHSGNKNDAYLTALLHQQWRSETVVEMMSFLYLMYMNPFNYSIDEIQHSLETIYQINRQLRTNEFLNITYDYSQHLEYLLKHWEAYEGDNLKAIFLEKPMQLSIELLNHIDSKLATHDRRMNPVDFARFHGRKIDMSYFNYVKD